MHSFSARFLPALVGLAFLLFPLRVFGEPPLPVTVSIGPQKYFVEKIGAGVVEVNVMVEPGVDPHVYDPKPRQMAAVAKSRVYFAVGVPFEDAWLEKFKSANPSIVILHTEDGVERIPMVEEEHDAAGHGHGHAAGAEGEDLHRPSGLDPHVWLSPPAVLVQARNILEGLVRVDPGHSRLYEENYRKFAAEIVDLDIELMSLFRDAGGRRGFMVFHPAWGYFAKAYGLVQVPVEVEGKEPKAADLERLIGSARERGIKTIFVQPQFSSSSAKVIAEAIGGVIVSADPMAGDWAENLRRIGGLFKAALK